ncbi:MAG: hypothetical protein ACKO1U_05455, partial [Bacteroidota bacterium]
MIVTIGPSVSFRRALQWLTSCCILLNASIVVGQSSLPGGSADNRFGQFAPHPGVIESSATPELRSAFLPPANDDCNSAAPLTVNAACTSGTTDQGTVQAGESTTPGCVTSAFTQTVWYRFVATSTTM